MSGVGGWQQGPKGIGQTARLFNQMVLALEDLIPSALNLSMIPSQCFQNSQSVGISHSSVASLIDSHPEDTPFILAVNALIADFLWGGLQQTRVVLI